MTIYLLKASACVALFYLVYLVLFRHTTWFQLNRAYLLSGLVLSFVVPLVVIHIAPVEIASDILQEGYSAMDGLRYPVATVSVSRNFPFGGYLYYSGVAVSLLVTVISVLKTLRLYMKADRVVRNRQVIIIHPGIQPFSFFGVLFLRSGDEDPIIIQHEMVHIRQRHWIDLVMVEIAAIVLWFNPFIHFYRRSLLMQHEYIADQQVTLSVPVQTYLECIAMQLESRVRSGLVNNFNTQSIKQGIMMVTNGKSYSAVRYAIVLPVVALLVMAFATRKTPEVPAMQNKELRSPVDIAKLKRGEGAGFGKKINPTTNKEQFHKGVDFVLAAGNSVYAVADGVVVKAENSGDYGNLIIVEHSKKLRTSSAHLEKILVKAGEKVKAGQLIGIVGSTGLSTGPHLHFEVLENGKAVDPVPYLNMSMD